MMSGNARNFFMTLIAFITLTNDSVSSRTYSFFSLAATLFDVISSSCFGAPTRDPSQPSCNTANPIRTIFIILLGSWRNYEVCRRVMSSNYSKFMCFQLTKVYWFLRFFYVGLNIRKNTYAKVKNGKQTFSFFSIHRISIYGERRSFNILGSLVTIVETTRPASTEHGVSRGRNYCSNGKTPPTLFQYSAIISRCDRGRKVFHHRLVQ